ncbi:MAG: hypothetical protein FWH26_11725, partial [Oscillospiraceae bacterium]|nr:hypothetical protein [Oscillospiraceae bacterium]
MKQHSGKTALVLCAVLLLGILPLRGLVPAQAAQTIRSSENGGLHKLATDFASQYIVIKGKAMGASHYAYTDALAETAHSPGISQEYNFRPGAQMVLLSMAAAAGRVTIREEILIDDSRGVLRDPDVSPDGMTVLYSHKKHEGDDFHLYKMDLYSREVTQLTFGSGAADVEPKFLPDGKIVFSSTRCTQVVDCWITPVMNMFVCDPDGGNVRRVGYDQVHTTYPTVTADGRVLYTRWDYNDRNQMYIQGIFQMFPDGTNQTEVYGNNNSFPTSLLHTREIPGQPSKYITVVSGHHTYQKGKLAIVDTALGRNHPDAVQFLFQRRDTGFDKSPNTDHQGQEGIQYKYPYAVNDHEFLVSSIDSTGISDPDAKFNIYYMNSQTGAKELISSYASGGNGILGAAQIVPVRTRAMFERPSMVNESMSTGRFYVGNVYEGEGLAGVPVGEAKYLRVVALEFRTAAIGANTSLGLGGSDPSTPVGSGNTAWDVKKILGIVDIEADGSALFEVPAYTPVYFQVLDGEGELIQSMRSWSTLMPNETFSCVGCHEDKNTAPPVQARRTVAMEKGVQRLRRDLWMTDGTHEIYDPYSHAEGFSYLKEIQPILDKSCVSCHNDRDAAAA